MNKREGKTRFELLGISEFEKRSNEIFVEVSDQSKIRVLHLKCEKQAEYSILVVAGWASIPLGWDDFLLEAVKEFDIYYLETREKKSSILNDNTVNDIPRMAMDISEVAKKLNLNHKKTILFSSSFGTLLSAYALVHSSFHPFLTVLIGPIAKVEMPPLIGTLVKFLPIPILRLYKPIGKSWIKLFKSESEEQAAKYLRVIREADEVKWKKIGKVLPRKEYWDLYEKLQTQGKILVVDESKDKMHNTKITKKIASKIKNALYIDLHTNYFTHSTEMARFLTKFIQ